MGTAIVYIGIGSNLDGPIRQVRRAIDELDTLPQTRCLARSSLYQSEPLVVEGSSELQPDYINAVVKLETGLDPWTLLRELHHLEAVRGRVREKRWGPRPLDLDLLLYDQRELADSELTVPHPGLYDRNFVLYPLAEITPDLVIPGAGDIGGLLARCPRGSLKIVEQS
ncbi:2-amino-4-hydroxy-6-hydroxymethyldihydropteridine diphosphokinase [Kaarinaea lacus]